MTHDFHLVVRGTLVRRLTFLEDFENRSFYESVGIVNSIKSNFNTQESQKICWEKNNSSGFIICFIFDQIWNRQYISPNIYFHELTFSST